MKIKKYTKENWGKGYFFCKCPVCGKECTIYGLSNHVTQKARTELLAKYCGVTKKIEHAKLYKQNYDGVVVEQARPKVAFMFKEK